jgi:hypothetical protein
MPTTGLKLPASASGLSGTWTTVGNLTANDNATASVTPPKSGSAQAQGQNFGVSVPAGSTTDSVIAEYKVREATANTNYTANLLVYVGGVLAFTSPAIQMTASLAVYQYDITSQRAWTPEDFANGTLTMRVQFSRGNTNTGVVCHADYIGITVTYTEGVPPQTYYVTLTGASAAQATGTATFQAARFFRRTLAATAAGTASLVKKGRKLAQATATGAGAVRKAVHKGVTATATGTASFRKGARRTLQAAGLGAATLMHQLVGGAQTFYVALTATGTGTASVRKAARHALTATATGTAALLKRARKALRATGTALGVIASRLVTGAQVFHVSMMATATATASVLKGARRTITATANGAATLAQQFVSGVRTFYVHMTAQATGTAALLKTARVKLATATAQGTVSMLTRITQFVARLIPSIRGFLIKHEDRGTEVHAEKRVYVEWPEDRGLTERPEDRGTIWTWAEGDTAMGDRQPEKHAADILDYDFRFGVWLPKGDTITSVDPIEVSPNDATLVKGEVQQATKEVKVWLSGGTPGTEYDVICVIHTAQGRARKAVITIPVIA